jgi:HK97 family phage major capsid protein
MELYANPATTQTLLDDAFVDIGQWLADEVSITFAEQEGLAFINGTGVKKPRGILGYTTVADANYAWGKIGYLGTGGAAFAADPAGLDKLISMVYALKQGYRTNASFLANRTTIGVIRQMKDSQGHYQWQPSSQIGEPPTLLGYPIVDDDNMDDLGANKYPVAFADFKRAYVIVDRIGTRVLRDPFSNKPYVSFYTTKRVGGGVQNFEAIKLLKCA